MEISSRLKEWPADTPSITVQYDIPLDFDGLVARFGKEVVASKAIDSIVIDVQSNIRRLVRKVTKEGAREYTDGQIQEKVTAYVPSSATAVRRSPAEKVSDLVGRMTAEEKAALLRQLKEASKS